MPQYQPFQRFGDSERDKVAARLTDAYAEGRLDHDEFNQRLDALYRAQTYGELEPLVNDLPAVRAQAKPENDLAPVGRPGSVAPADKAGGDWYAPIVGLAGVLAINVAVWAVIFVTTGHMPYFWPVWLLIPVAAVSVRSVQERNSRQVRDQRRRRELGQ